MKKIAKIMSVVLVMTLVVAMATVSAFAAEPTSIRVITPPDRTVYVDGLDNFDNEIWCDATGMVLEITNSDGTTEELVVDEYSYVYVTVYDYVIGENEAVVEYLGTDDVDVYLTTTVTITVEENPVASVEITKMPDKTEYDMDNDVMTRETFSWDKIYAADPQGTEEMLAILGMTFDEFKEFYESNPEYQEVILDAVFAEYEQVLLFDTAGMEMLVTFKDGSQTTVSGTDYYINYKGTDYPITLEQTSGTITEGKNTVVVNVMGYEVLYDVTVTKADNSQDTPNPEEKPEETPEVKPENKPADDLKNPVIPNTDVGVSVAAAAVVALMSGCGIALIPNKKKN